MVKGEIQREKLKERAGRKAWLFEERLAEEKESEKARMCLRELREKGKKGITRSRWEEKKKRFFVEKGLGLEEVERAREERELV